MKRLLFEPAATQGVRLLSLAIYPVLQRFQLMLMTDVKCLILLWNFMVNEC